jgi:hypothetical protein
VAALVEREERRIAERPGYRTPASTLKRIATCNLLYEVDSRQSTVDSGRSEWDRFHVRRLGLAVNRRMAREFAGDAERIRSSSARSVARKLRVNPSRWKEGERRSFESYALVLDLISGLDRWSSQEKRDLLAVIRSKAGRSEAAYLRRMQRHRRLRDALIELGSRSGSRS